MEKQAKYLITGIWYNTSGTTHRHISHFLIHDSSNETTVFKGVKYTLSEAVVFIRSLERTNYYCCTASWNYSTTGWHVNSRAIIEIETTTTGSYLRTKADTTENDNLSHMINLVVFPM